jgi:MFS family permease
VQGRYSRVLTQPGVARTLVPYLVARLPASMILLALLLFIKQTSGSFVTAGAVSAAFAVAVAVTAPVLGRLVDVRGQTTVLLVTCITHPLALVAVLVTATEDRSPVLVLASAAVAGASMPPMSACMRALWPSLLSDDDQRKTAFSLEAIVVEACELGGPLLVGGFMVVMSPAAAVVATGVLTCVGALMFALSPTSRTWRSAGWSTRRWRGPLATPGVRWLLAIIACSTGGFAAFEVAVAGFATAHSGAASAGTLLAIWFAGSLLGGWWYGARRTGAPLPWQLVVLLGAVAAGGLLPMLARDTWTMAALLLVSGVAIAPAIAVQLALMSEVAPERSRTEAFTWASTANFVGIGAGSAVAGWAVEHGGFRSGLLCSAGLALVTTALAVFGRYGLGLRAPDREAAQDAYDLAIFQELADQRDVALHELARAIGRTEELEQQLAGRRQPGNEPPTGVGDAGVSAAMDAAALVRSGLARLDSSLADLYLLEQRRAAVLHDIEQLRAELQSTGLPHNVTALPRQSHGT